MTDSVAIIAENWLTRFEGALAAGGAGPLKALFHCDTHWRDVLALSWRIKTISGSDAVLRELPSHAARVRPAAFKIAEGRVAPRSVTRAGIEAIEAIFSFETAQGRGSGNQWVMITQGGTTGA